MSGHHVAELARASQDAGADALMAMPPYIVPGSADSTFAYYEKICNATNLPLIVQNAPAPFSSPLTTGQLVNLLEHFPQIEVIKEETFPNPQKVGQLYKAAGEKIKGIFGGLGGIYLFNELSRGGSGTMPACQFADVMVDIFNLWQKGNKEEARDCFMAVQPALVMEGLYKMTFMKECLKRRKVFKNTLTRTPEPALDKHDLEELDAIWERFVALFSHLSITPSIFNSQVIPALILSLNSSSIKTRDHPKPQSKSGWVLFQQRAADYLLVWPVYLSI